MTRWLVSINPSETRGQQTRRPAAGRGIQFWHQCTMYINRYLEFSYIWSSWNVVSTITSINNNEKRSLKPPVNESPRVLTDIDVKIGGDGSCSYQFRVAGLVGCCWASVAPQLDAALHSPGHPSFTHNQAIASAEKLAFVENRKIEVKWWHFTKIKVCYMTSMCGVT